MFKALNSLLKPLMIAFIRFYQLFISPLMLPSCKYIPTCSEYSKQAFIKYPFFKAFIISSKRILRCNPFSKGGYDPLR